MAYKMYKLSLHQFFFFFFEQKDVDIAASFEILFVINLHLGIFFTCQISYVDFMLFEYLDQHKILDASLLEPHDNLKVSIIWFFKIKISFS